MREWELSKIFVGVWRAAENIGPIFVFKPTVAEIKKAKHAKNIKHKIESEVSIFAVICCIYRSASKFLW